MRSLLLGVLVLFVVVAEEAARAPVRVVFKSCSG